MKEKSNMNQLLHSLPVNSNQISKMKDTEDTYLINERRERRGHFQTSLVTPEEVKENYQAIKLHFSSKNYNYNKYNGKVKSNIYKDLVPYSMIAKGKRKDDFPDFFIPGLFQNPKIGINFFLTDDYISVWKYWVSYQKSPKYFFERELIDLREYLDKRNLQTDEIFRIKTNELPLIYKFIVKNQISPQTFLYLDKVFDFSKRMDLKISEKIYYPIVKARLSKLETFLKSKEREDLKKIVKNVFNT